MVEAHIWLNWFVLDMSQAAISAQKTLKASGGHITLVPYSTGGGRYDPATGETVSKSSDGVIRVGALFDSLRKIPIKTFGQQDGVDTEVEGAQKWLLMDAIGIEPKVRYRVIVGIDTYTVLNVQVVADADGPVIYILALRR